MFPSKHFRQKPSVFIGLLVAWSWLCPAPLSAAEIVVGGAGAANGTLLALGVEYSKAQPDNQIKLLPSLGSNGGIKALISGKIAIALSGRPLYESERGAGLVEREFAHTPLVIAVSNKNNVSHLTLDELAALYAGRTTRWPDGTPVRAVLRPVRDSDTAILKTFSPAVAQAASAALAREGMLVAITDTDSADALERLPGAFGTASLSTLVSEKRALKPLAIAGFDPSVTARRDNRYPWHKTIYLITRNTAPPEVADFLAFVRTPAAHTVLRASGSVPAGSK